MTAFKEGTSKPCGPTVIEVGVDVPKPVLSSLNRQNDWFGTAPPAERPRAEVTNIVLYTNVSATLK